MDIMALHKRHVSLPIRFLTPGLFAQWGQTLQLLKPVEHHGEMRCRERFAVFDHEKPLPVSGYIIRSVGISSRRVAVDEQGLGVSAGLPASIVTAMTYPSPR